MVRLREKNKKQKEVGLKKLIEVKREHMMVNKRRRRRRVNHPRRRKKHKPQSSRSQAPS